MPLREVPATMAHSAAAVANEFLELAKKAGRTLTPMQLQKLVYIAHGWSLAITGHPLVDERVEAWQWGPVYPSLYDALKFYGSGTVKDEIHRNNWASNEAIRGPVVAEDFTAEETAIIQKVWEVYGDLEAFQLSALTHDENTPWSKSYDGTRHKVIPNSAIREHFLELADQRAA